jgi:pilus assembly protein Flp/PilA
MKENSLSKIANRRRLYRYSSHPTDAFPGSSAACCNLFSAILSCLGTRHANHFFQEGFIMLFAPKERGQGLVEYAIILSLVAVLVVAVVRVMGPRIGETYSTINSSLP